MTSEQLGSCDRITVTENDTTIVGGRGDQKLLDARVSQLEAQLERTKIEGDRDSLELRIARLTGRVAVVRVGGATSVELKERMLRVEDAVAASRAALSRASCPEVAPHWHSPTEFSTTSGSTVIRRSAWRSSAKRSPSRCAGSPSTPDSRATTSSTW